MLSIFVFMNIYDNLRTEKQYKATTSLGMEEFDRLHEYFARHYRPKSTKPHPAKSKQPVLTDSRQALFFVLHYLKAYPTLECMGLYFGFDVRTVSDYLGRTRHALYLALSDMGHMSPTLFGSQQDFDRAFKGMDYLFLDATEVATDRSVDAGGQRFSYSGKKKRHTCKALVVSGFDRAIHYLGCLWNGKAHDKRIYDSELGGFDYSGKRRLADLGFLGLRAQGTDDAVLLPWKKPKNGELTEEEKADNRVLAAIRVRVEHAIGGMKRCFILRHTHRFHYNRLSHEAMRLCAGLWNMKIASG